MSFNRNYLDAGTSSKCSPCCPIVLIEGVFDRDDREIFYELMVQFCQLFVFDKRCRVRSGILKV